MFSSHLCLDIDQFMELAIQLGWQLESTQISCGANRIQFDCFAFPELHVAYHSVKQAMYDCFDIPWGSLVIILRRAKLSAVCSGIKVLPSMLTILSSMNRYWVKLPAGWEAYEFTLSEELIERTELFPPSFFEKIIQLEQSFLPLSESQTEYFLRGIDYFFKRLRNRHGAIEGAIDKTEFYDFILYGLQQLIDISLAASYSQPISYSRRFDLVEKAREMMLSNLTSNLTADEIAKILGVSYRVLHYSFQETLGISPYKFFLTKKLHEVRRLLKSSDISITEASTSQGFSSPSRFTQQYKRLFGEIPSETKLRHNFVHFLDKG